MRNKINLNHNSSVVVDDYLLNGVSSVSISYEQPIKVLSPMGISNGLSFSSGPPSQNMSISRSLYYKDPIIDFTGQNLPIKADILDNKNKEFYGFYSGYMTNYSVSCAVGSLPKVNTTFKVFDEILSGDYNSEKYVGQSYKAPPASLKLTQESILINSPDFNDNRIVGFSYSINMDHKVYYGLGSSSPFKVDRTNPVKYTANIQLELGGYVDGGSFDFLNSRRYRDLSVSINDFRGGIVQGFTMPRASLRGKSLKHSSNGAMILDLKYVGHNSNY